MIELIIKNPVVSIPLLVLSLQIIVKIIANLRSRDWYGLYISLSYMGVELNIITLVTFFGLSITRGKALLLKIYPDVKTDGDLLVVFSLTIFFFIVLLAISLYLFYEASNIGRDKFSICSKASSVRRLFISDIASAMLLSVANQSAYSRNQGMWQLGLLLTFISISTGSLATAVFLKLTVG